jgi:hypothetical protein
MSHKALLLMQHVLRCAAQLAGVQVFITARDSHIMPRVRKRFSLHVDTAARWIAVDILRDKCGSAQADELFRIQLVEACNLAQSEAACVTAHLFSYCRFCQESQGPALVVTMCVADGTALAASGSSQFFVWDPVLPYRKGL